MRGIILGTTIGLTKEDTRSLDYGSCWGGGISFPLGLKPTDYLVSQLLGRALNLACVQTQK